MHKRVVENRLSQLYKGSKTFIILALSSSLCICILVITNSCDQTNPVGTNSTCNERDPLKILTLNLALCSWWGTSQAVVDALLVTATLSQNKELTHGMGQVPLRSAADRWSMVCYSLAGSTVQVYSILRKVAQLRSLQMKTRYQSTRGCIRYCKIFLAHITWKRNLKVELWDLSYKWYASIQYFEAL